MINLFQGIIFTIKPNIITILIYLILFVIGSYVQYCGFETKIIPVQFHYNVIKYSKTVTGEGEN